MDQADHIADRLRKSRAEFRRLTACNIEVPDSLLFSIQHDEALLRMPQFYEEPEDLGAPLEWADFAKVCAVVVVIFLLVWWATS